MKQTVRFAAFIIAVISISVIVSSCSESASGVPDDLIINMPYGKEITLYMQRSEVEKLIGKGEESSFIYTAEYDGFSLGYTDGLLTAIEIESEKVKTKSGITVGTDINKPKTIKKIGKDTGGSMYKYDKEKGTYEVFEGVDDAGEMQKLAGEVNAEQEKVQKAATLSCRYDEEDEIIFLMIVDYHIGQTNVMDDY